MAAFGRLFAEDAQMVNVIGIWWKNRAELESAQAELHAGPFRSRLGAAISPAARRRSSGDPHTLAALKRRDGSPEGERRGILLLVARKGRAGWRIEVAQNTDIMPGITVPFAPWAGFA